MKVPLSLIEDFEPGPHLRFGLRYSCTAFGAIAFTKAPEDWRTQGPNGPCATPGVQAFSIQGFQSVPSRSKAFSRKKRLFIFYENRGRERQGERRSED